MTDKKFPLDIAMEVVEEKIFDNPEALACLKVLEKLHTEIDAKLSEANQLQERYESSAQEMQNILDLLGLREYSLPNKFRASFRTYRNLTEINDPAAFMGWLKTNFSSTEIVNFLKPPTTKAELKKFCEKWLDENAGSDIPGVETEITYIRITTDYKGFTRVKRKSSYKSYRGRKKSSK